MQIQDIITIIIYTAVFVVVTGVYSVVAFGAKLKNRYKNNKYSLFKLILLIIVILPLCVIGIFFMFGILFGISAAVFKHDQLLKHIATNIPNILAIVYLSKSFLSKE